MRSYTSRAGFIISVDSSSNNTSSRITRSSWRSVNFHVYNLWIKIYNSCLLAQDILSVEVWTPIIRNLTIFLNKLKWLRKTITLSRDNLFCINLVFVANNAVALAHVWIEYSYSFIFLLEAIKRVWCKLARCETII